MACEYGIPDSVIDDLKDNWRTPCFFG
jgi:hypothetical protein